MHLESKMLSEVHIVFMLGLTRNDKIIYLICIILKLYSNCVIIFKTKINKRDKYARESAGCNRYSK